MQAENFAAQPGPRVSQIAFQLEHEDAADAAFEKTDMDPARSSSAVKDDFRKDASTVLVRL